MLLYFLFFLIKIVTLQRVLTYVIVGTWNELMVPWSFYWRGKMLVVGDELNKGGF